LADYRNQKEEIVVARRGKQPSFVRRMQHDRVTD
jgi:hypothetical protein